MTKLKDVIPEESLTVRKIYEYHKRLGDSEEARGYLGASSIGMECERALWYQFRGCVKPEFDGRMYRLFETGDLAEHRFTKELKAIGCEVKEVDENGEQFEVKEFNGHFSGHTDGVALGIPEAPKTWHVLEYKTHNDKSFAKLEKEGVAKAKPQHHAQMMVYMGLTKLTRALYLAVNKNTDKLYSERIKFDKVEFNRLMSKAERIITSVQPPERIATRPDTFACKWCDAYDLCWGTSEVALPIPSKGCRTCCHATPELTGNDKRWSCALHKKDIDTLDQQNACDNHLILPGLITFAETSDASNTHIEFTNKEDGVMWKHGKGDGMFTTEELMNTPVDMLNKSVVDVKDMFDGTIVDVEQPEIKLPKTLLEKYPHEDSRLLWETDDFGNMGTDNITSFLEWVQNEYAGGADITGEECTDNEIVTEFGNKILVVIYIYNNYAVVWEGVE